MIAKIIKGKGVRGLLAYLHGDNEQPRGRRVAGNMAGHSIRELAAEFGLFRKLRPTLGRAVAHISLSPASEDRMLTDEEWQQIAARLLTDLGFTECPWVAFMHTDTDHPHIHIAVSRVTFSGDVVSDAGDFRRAETSVRRIENAFGLAALQTKQQPKRRQSVNEENKDQSEIDPAPENIPEQPAPVLPVRLKDQEISVSGIDTLPGSVTHNMAYCFDNALIFDTLGTELRRIERKGKTRLLHLKPDGLIIEQTNKLTAKFLDEDRAAFLLLDLAEAKGWTEISFTGPEAFVRRAIELAIKRGIVVKPRDQLQAALLEEISGEIRPSGALAGAAGGRVTSPPIPAMPMGNISSKLAERRKEAQKRGGRSGGQRPKTQKPSGGKS